MYISLNQISTLDKIVKGFEVALRSFVAENLFKKYETSENFSAALNGIKFSGEVIYSKKFEAKIKSFVKNSEASFEAIANSSEAISSKVFDHDVPYVSDVVDLLLIFFNDVFLAKNITKLFATIEEFHYCASLYHAVRNNLSHPASHPIDEADAVKVNHFILNLTRTLEEKYFWYFPKRMIELCIVEYQNLNSTIALKVDNLNFAPVSHKQLLCRDVEITKLYSAIIGDEQRKRVAGSVVIYGYGGVGKTAITTEFLLRLLRDKRDGKHADIDFILFYSSKDEYLRSSESTGMFYIDQATPQFSTLEELKNLIQIALAIDSMDDIVKYRRGIIVIDNIENIPDAEKASILNFIKGIPRSIQFILTSRSEESCEEKIHVGEFAKDEFGLQFVASLADAEGFDLEITDEMAYRLLDVSKGNALIILQTLNSLSRRLSTFSDITLSLESLKSSNSENVANFMYKNTFDGVLRDLSGENYPVEKVIQIISLYEERIELYSISKLAEVEIKSAETLCNVLLQRLILSKSGEYYELNEFAKRFIFTKLLPDKIMLRKLKNDIAEHKKRMKEKLSSLESTLEKKKKIGKIMSEWQPRNYIDKMVIAETCLLYFDAYEKAIRKDRAGLDQSLTEFAAHRVRTNHPYVALQEARLLKLFLKFRDGRNNPPLMEKISTAYEEAIDAIQFDCVYLANTHAHASLSMLYGIFLGAEFDKPSRAIRYLEDARRDSEKSFGKVWVMSCQYLALCYRKVLESGVEEYRESLFEVCRKLVSCEAKISRRWINMEKFKRDFAAYIDTGSSLPPSYSA